MQRAHPKTRIPWALWALLLASTMLIHPVMAEDKPALPQGVVATLKGHTEIVYTVAFSPDGKQVLTGSFDKTLKLWETAAGKEIKTFSGAAGHQNLVLSVAFTPDGQLLASGAADNTAKLWDSQKAGSEPPIKNLAHPNLVDAVAFNSDGTQLATGCHDGSVRIWDVAKGQQVREIKAHTTPMMTQVYCVAWSPDGKQLVSGSLDHSLRLWDAAAGNLVRQFKAYNAKEVIPVSAASAVGMLRSPLAQSVFLLASVIIPGKAEKDLEKGHREGVFCAAFSPDSKLLASGSGDRTIKIWNVTDGSVVHDLMNPHLKPAASARVPASAAPPQAHPGWVYGLRFTPSGTHLVSVGMAPRNHGYLAVWNVADGKLLYSGELPLGAIYSVAISPDGKLLALACGPRGRQFQEANCYLMKMPEPDSTPASDAGK